MTNRRDLLKLFTAGASIVPIIGGAPVVAAQARLIEPPKIEPVRPVAVFANGMHRCPSCGWMPKYLRPIQHSFFGSIEKDRDIFLMQDIYLGTGQKNDGQFLEDVRTLALENWASVENAQAEMNRVQANLHRHTNEYIHPPRSRFDYFVVCH